MERMFAAGLPRYAHAQLQANGKPVDPAAPPLRFGVPVTIEP